MNCGILAKFFFASLLASHWGRSSTIMAEHYFPYWLKNGHVSTQRQRDTLTRDLTTGLLNNQDMYHKLCIQGRPILSAFLSFSNVKLLPTILAL